MDSRPGTGFPIAASQTQNGATRSPEPSVKRLRLDTSIEASRFPQCLKSQVFPHVDSAIATLPKDKVNTIEIGKRDYQLVHANPLSSAPLPTPIPPPILTPIPPPPIPFTRSPGLRWVASAASAASTAKRYSSSPIPLPAVPHHLPFKAPEKANGTTSSGSPKLLKTGSPEQPAGPQPEVIIIDDDDDTPADKAVVAQKPEITKPAACSIRLAAEPLAKTPTASQTGPPENLTLTPVRPPSAFSVLSQNEESTILDFREEAQSLVWRRRRPVEHEEIPMSKWFSATRHPYIAAGERALIMSGAQRFIRQDLSSLRSPVIFHVDFTTDEINYIRTLARKTLHLSAGKKKRDAQKDLRKILTKNQSHIRRIANAAWRLGRLPRRSKADIEEFFRDVMDQKTRRYPALLSIRRDDRDQRGDLIQTSRVHSLLLAREVGGQRGLGSMRRLDHFNNEFRKCREDALEVRAEWTDCAGDISTIVWVSNDGFICGTTEHSDSHNQQYNKPGNLVLGSCSLGTLRAYPDHRIVRPVVQKGENSTEAMRQSLDPWLYSSVVSSDYDATHDRAFTSGFDRSVKIWRVQQSGVSMSLLGEWKHSGNVNFVAASKHESGLVATAADVAADAIRIYSIDESNISNSPFRSYSCSRVTDAEGNTVPTEKWAYYPATMQWGLAEGAEHLLLVGYSPRSRTDDDNDIPEDRRDSGELCLWDGLTGERWRITSATTQNVFEVLWHPTQLSFIAATSPLGQDLEPSVRTQIRIFRPADREEYGIKAFSPIKTLDCTAIDINELTIMPNSYTYGYVTAGCTDGNTYVWDTALGDKPIHVLRHSEPIDEYRGDREREDVGVKFTAWGTTPDRFYTGSSDGVVKVWNVRSHGKPHVRNLLEAPAPITSGMFSPDRSRLVVGDASGRVFMLSVDEEEQRPAPFVQLKLPGARDFRTVRRPIPIIQHPEPPPPSHDAAGRPIESETGSARGRAYLERLQLKRHPNPTVGVVQGPRYADTGLYRREAHFHEDPSQPLLACWEVMQQEASKGFVGRRRDQFMVLRPVKESEDLENVHLKNIQLDLDIGSLSEETRLSLESEGVDFGLMTDCILDYEEMPYVEEYE
ncbi:hypothetical protein MFIFM68171_03218 [Madurella fahalii]|uniref:Uncharacterized protein n=1 Tax=Madurella fahalii TaxID=1157608 RepID=A0ABQ0G5H2_9PEZI